MAKCHKALNTQCQTGIEAGRKSVKVGIVKEGFKKQLVFKLNLKAWLIFVQLDRQNTCLSGEEKILDKYMKPE